MAKPLGQRNRRLRWRVTVAERKAMVEALYRLTDASADVPIKQCSRTPEQQRAVEAWTAAVVEARALLRELSEKHYGDDVIVVPYSPAPDYGPKASR